MVLTSLNERVSNLESQVYDMCWTNCYLMDYLNATEINYEINNTVFQFGSLGKCMEDCEEGSIETKIKKPDIEAINMETYWLDTYNATKEEVEAKTGQKMKLVLRSEEGIRGSLWEYVEEGD